MVAYISIPPNLQIFNSYPTPKRVSNINHGGRYVHIKVNMKELFSVRLRPIGQFFFAYTLNIGFIGDFKGLTTFCG